MAKPKAINLKKLIAFVLHIIEKKIMQDKIKRLL